MIKTQKCGGCGAETFKIKWEMSPEGGMEWAECAECGRPTSTFGDGLEKQNEWLHEQLEEDNE